MINLKFTSILITICFFTATLYSQEYASQSALRKGDIYKVAVKETGVYRITYDDLNNMGANPSSIDPKSIQVFGGHPSALPNAIAEEKIDDLLELHIQVVGESDGSWDPEDFILFYAQGPDAWEIKNESEFSYSKNIYSDLNYYFVRIADETGLRISKSDPIGATQTVSTYLDHQHYEKDEQNLLHFANNANLQGSGQRWFGDVFQIQREFQYDEFFDFDHRIVDQPISVEFSFAGRSRVRSSVNLTLGGETITGSISSTNIFNIEARYARDVTVHEEIITSEEFPELRINYPNITSPQNIGFLDFITLSFERALVYKRGRQLSFRHPASLSQDLSYELRTEVSSDVTIWDVTSPFQVKEMESERMGDQISFSALGGELNEYMVWDENNLLRVDLIGKIENQNLHEPRDIDYLMIYHSKFKEAADRLEQFRKDHNGFATFSVDVEKVYNEFSSGKVDPSAIRNFVRKVYRESENMEYLVLVGDGSFDFRHRYTNMNDESFIPVYETEESFGPILAYPTDDYYALLSDQDGANGLRGALEISVGRLPVRTLVEANTIVQKTIDYETSTEMLGDWRLNLLFVADDEDANRHMRTSDQIAERLKTSYPDFNSNKVFIDAYEQENTSGGVFNPSAQQAINQNIFQGQLVVNYIGHGGSTGWAQERILRHEDVDKWNNRDRLPLIITATCSFAGYDDPKETTAGEYTLINPDGGAVALFTTVRAVYASDNERLTKEVFEHLFETVDGQYRNIGEILKVSKNANQTDTLRQNARKFTLLGDPALRLAIPKYSVQTTKVNGQDVNDFTDTLNSLTPVTIEGIIVNQDGQLASDFNGAIYPTIFDKKLRLQNLGQDGTPVDTFEVQQNVIFKGEATVSNGEFNISFVVPADINYIFGKGKISYYAENGTTVDAGGEFNDLVIGGSVEDGINDDQGPIILAYLNDETFVSGDRVAPNPTLLINLEDDNGINVTGNSIGHDLVATINGQDKVVLNPFYNAVRDDYRRGSVIFPLDDLPIGFHTITIKAWDVANNSSSVTIEFEIVDEFESDIHDIINIPNPFSNETSFQFEHEFPNRNLQFRLDIYDTMGRLITSLISNQPNASAVNRDFVWDGSDTYGDSLSGGIYFYKISIMTNNGFFTQTLAESELRKLIKLR